MSSSTLVGYDECKIFGHVPTDVQNPRLQNLCGRCGRVREPDELGRDLDRERRWISEAAQYAQYVSEPDGISEAFSTYRELRTNSDAPWRDVSSRNFAVEAIEEAVDLSAYVMALLQQIDEGRDDEDAGKAIMLLKMALAASVTAYASLSEYMRVDL